VTDGSILIYGNDDNAQKCASPTSPFSPVRVTVDDRVWPQLSPCMGDMGLFYYALLTVD